MRSDASIDEESLRRYVDWLVGQGVRGLAVNVDTGEGPHLFPEERLRVLEIVAEEVGGRALVVAGLAASFTEQARRLAADTARAGAGRPARLPHLRVPGRAAGPRDSRLVPPCGGRGLRSSRSSPSSSSPRWAG